ncbi:uncharacterized protein LOC108029566 [Drosophila biarmipes]|uniref:uncharacterized protein LOC108029566 n=1 Tax=Drosophila biarmipes TaxID=125945 RepID=UPI0007E62B63|nr:uncharacterized protein LOC108029566 [Drosophila biarmipes]
MSTEEIEAAFKGHQGTGSQVKKAYEEAIEKTFVDLSASHLEECEAIYEQHEESALDTEYIINRIRSLMTKAVFDLNSCFFASNNLEKKIATLEMLKEQFAHYEGKNWCWNFNTAVPDKLTRPLRMRCLDFSLNFVEQQLKSQEKELEIATAKYNDNRDRVQNLLDERLKLNAKMKQQLSEYNLLKPELIKIGQLINNSYLKTENEINY